MRKYLSIISVVFLSFALSGCSKNDVYELTFSTDNFELEQYEFDGGSDNDLLDLGERTSEFSDWLFDNVLENLESPDYFSTVQDLEVDEDISTLFPEKMIDPTHVYYKAYKDDFVDANYINKLKYEAYSTYIYASLFSGIDHVVNDYSSLVEGELLITDNESEYSEIQFEMDEANLSITYNFIYKDPNDIYNTGNITTIKLLDIYDNDQHVIIVELYEVFGHIEHYTFLKIVDGKSIYNTSFSRTSEYGTYYQRYFDLENDEYSSIEFRSMQFFEGSIDWLSASIGLTKYSKSDDLLYRYYSIDDIITERIILFDESEPVLEYTLSDDEKTTLINMRYIDGFDYVGGLDQYTSNNSYFMKDNDIIEIDDSSFNVGNFSMLFLSLNKSEFIKLEDIEDEIGPLTLDFNADINVSNEFDNYKDMSKRYSFDDDTSILTLDGLDFNIYSIEFFRYVAGDQFIAELHDFVGHYDEETARNYE